MKYLKNVLFIVIAISLLSVKQDLQNSTNKLMATTTNLQQLLMSKEWKALNAEDSSWRFTETEMLFYDQGELSVRTKYYITNTSCYQVENPYNPSLLGTKTHGDYIVDEDGRCEAVEIVDNNKIIFYHLHESAAPTFILVAK